MRVDLKMSSILLQILTKRIQTFVGRSVASKELDFGFHLGFHPHNRQNPRTTRAVSNPNITSITAYGALSNRDYGSNRQLPLQIRSLTIWYMLLKVCSDRTASSLPHHNPTRHKRLFRSLFAVFEKCYIQTSSPSNGPRALCSRTP